MMPEDVRMAVDSLGTRFISTSDGAREVETIRAHLLAREAEVEMLRAPFSDEDATAGSHWFGEWVTWKRRCERAQALLREALPYCDTFPDLLRDGGDELRDRITAHLSENSHD